MAVITHIHARQIFDSRGNPTVEADVYLEGGPMGRSAVPSGASTGLHEAHELRDGGDLYGGKGVMSAVAHVRTDIAEAVVGMDAGDQGALDQAMIELDGTDTKSRLGANAILSVSLAAAKAEAAARGVPFYEYISTLSRIERTLVLPMPLANVLNGGMHAGFAMDIQECMVVPVGAVTYSDAIRMVAGVFHALRRVLESIGYPTTVGDEGGYAPHFAGGNREAFEVLARAVEEAGYRLGEDVAFALDVAASVLQDRDGRYVLKSEERELDTDSLIDLYGTLIHEFPIISIEDGLSETDWSGWQTMTGRMGEVVQLVGDDLLVTNTHLLKRAIEEKAANAILIKVNQIGTLTETIDAVDTAHEAGWGAIISHRSGETEDTSIAHLAVGLAVGQIKAGSMSRTDRVAKYNELLRIEEELGDRATFAGWR